MSVSLTYLETIKNFVLRALAGENVDIALFGSMVRGGTGRGSDVDIAVIPRPGWNRNALIHLRANVEDLNVPYKVEIIDFSEVTEDFLKEALTSVIWWKKDS